MKYQIPKCQARRLSVNSFTASAFGIFKGDLRSKVVLRFDALFVRFIKNEVWHADQTIREMVLLSKKVVLMNYCAHGIEGQKQKERIISRLTEIEWLHSPHNEGTR